MVSIIGMQLSVGGVAVYHLNPQPARTWRRCLFQLTGTLHLTAAVRLLRKGLQGNAAG